MVWLNNPLSGNLLKKEDARERGYIGIGITPKGLLLCAFILGRRQLSVKGVIRSLALRFHNRKGDPDGSPFFG
jgi:hypothetical protein